MLTRDPLTDNLHRNNTTKQKRHIIQLTRSAVWSHFKSVSKRNNHENIRLTLPLIKSVEHSPIRKQADETWLAGRQLQMEV